MGWNYNCNACGEPFVDHNLWDHPRLGYVYECHDKTLTMLRGSSHDKFVAAHRLAADYDLLKEESM